MRKENSFLKFADENNEYFIDCESMTFEFIVIQ